MIKKTFITLIDKYLSGTATTSERNLIEVCMDKLETDADSSAVTGGPLKEAMWQAILAGTMHEQEPVPVRKIAWYAKTGVYWAAACVACVVAATVVLVNNREQPVQEVAKETSKPGVPYIRHIQNIHNKDTPILLPDGSGVVLSAHSALSYTEPFTGKRAVTLTGKAEFSVKADKAHPFSVLSKAVNTVVLGTKFMVTAYEQSAQIKVRLFEGKVVVQPVSRHDKKMPDDFRLEPGQEFVYSNRAMAYVRPFGKKAEAEHDAVELAGQAVTLPAGTSGAWNLFNNQPLGLVFDQLSELYNVKIVYNKQDVRRKYFVGRFNKADSLDIILKYITTANRLTVVKEEEVYYIRR
ncbi:ferric-dicitrate binding protein FerR (iron transport regulator) [Filimonas zeae]|uniref:FecR family protein n=1 Tax=Filimonas zeae TaxID=1737353 RepID=A0A917IZR3_9BACT|nr:FecR family protein [Filimonas zeae]MDR6340749.1 ferric-dicitrate binding protein FerR (iron transport regulator) [Filimonas zeae]GGH74192.1 hypothetical protein GCM10011379_36540 [Filimonas zeae]